MIFGQGGDGWGVRISKVAMSRRLQSMQPRNACGGQHLLRCSLSRQAAIDSRVKALVFIGRNLQPGESGNLYFQDAESYMAGMRYESATGDGNAEFHTVAEGTPFVFEFERALDRLLYCR